MRHPFRAAPHRRGVIAGAAGAGLAALASGAFAARAKTRNAYAHTAYESLLLTWCDALVAHQVRGLADATVDGGFLCPGCGIVHGRSADAIYPLLCAARLTGRRDYVRAALAVYDWSERNVSCADGSWINEPVLSDWKGITVFRCVTLSESLLRHGDLLDAATRRAWRDRLRRAYGFLDGFITIDTGNINYPVGSAYAYALGAEVLGRPDYTDRARGLAHQALDYITPNALLFGEGHPQRGTTARGARPVDLGYNVEESLPALALYGLHARDDLVLERTVAMMRGHMEFMLPDGAWDNSWGSRNYKWTWWGSRTSDGCHSAYRLLADHDPRFAEVATRNLALMQRCTHDGLLMGGPGYAAAGYASCIHHSLSHAKSLATVIDSGIDAGKGAAIAPQALPRDGAYGLKSFDEIGTHLAAVGPWRATVTGYDWDYLAPDGGGHASGGALSLLFHQTIGPIFAASLTKYKVVEVANQQVPKDDNHQVLTPRIEAAGAERLTSLSDFAAKIAATAHGANVAFDVEGQLQTIGHQASGGVYTLGYAFGETVTISAQLSGGKGVLVLPVIVGEGETISPAGPGAVEVIKSRGRLRIVTDAAAGFEPLPTQRIFNLVPGFQAMALRIALADGQPVRVTISAWEGV